MAISEEDKQWLETRILGEFHRVQLRTDVRFHGLEANMRVNQVRLDDLEERVARLEEKR